MLSDLSELYGITVFGDRDELLSLVTVGEIRQTYQYAELRHRLTWAAIARAGLPPFQGAAWDRYDETALDLMVAESVLQLAEDEEP